MIKLLMICLLTLQIASCNCAPDETAEQDATDIDGEGNVEEEMGNEAEGDMVEEEIGGDAEGDMVEEEINPLCGNGRIDSGEECDDGNTAAGDGCEPDSCRYSCHGDIDCDDGHACTDDHCDTATMHMCLASTMSEAGTSCRDAAGECDIAEHCDGASQDCPPDEFLPMNTECRPAAGECDVAESCTGLSADCPVNGFQPPGTTCEDDNPLTYEDACDGRGLCAGIPEIIDISAGGDHTCALMSTRGLKCWGDNGLGQLGDGTNTDATVPVAVSGLASGATAIIAGGYHTCALTTSEGVKCWGSGVYGEIGEGIYVIRTAPVDVSGLSSGAASISAGDWHTCALTTSEGVMCWGLDHAGQVSGYFSGYPRAVVGL